MYLNLASVVCIAGVIHGDYNEQNLVVEKTPGGSSDASPHEEHDIVGVIDFGDMAETCYVYEVNFSFFSF